MHQADNLAEKVYRFVQVNGPVIPNQIKRAMGGEITLISAVLSELKDAGKIKVSTIKIGGSPLYYTPGQEIKLQNFRHCLNEKDQRAFDLLREKKVLRDYALETIMRFGFRKMKDFAVPLTVNMGGEKEIFWKWHLVSNNEAENLIKGMLGLKKEEKNVGYQRPVVAESPASHTAHTDTERLIVRKNLENMHEKKRTAEKERRPVQQPGTGEKSEAGLKKIDDTRESGVFLETIKSFFEKKGIKIVDKKTIRKDSDIEFLVKVPSAVGMVEYFCKAKNKKKNTDGDLSAAFLVGQSKKLPVLYVTTGEVAKKVKQKLTTELKGMVVSEI